MKIIDVKAQALSVPLEEGIVLGIGKVLRRDTVLVRVETASGVVGYGECSITAAPQVPLLTSSTACFAIFWSARMRAMSSDYGKKSTRCSSAAMGSAPGHRSP